MMSLNSPLFIAGIKYALCCLNVNSGSIISKRFDITPIDSQLLLEMSYKPQS